MRCFPVLIQLSLIIAPTTLTNHARQKRQIIFPGQTTGGNCDFGRRANNGICRERSEKGEEESGRSFGSLGRQQSGLNRVFDNLSAQCTVGECLPPTFCADLISGTTLISSVATCQLSDFSVGVCCERNLKRPLGPTQFPFSGPDKFVDIRFIDSNDIEQAAVDGNRFINIQRQKDLELLEQNVFVRSNTPNAGQLNFFRTSAKTVAIGLQSLQNTVASRVLRQRFNLTVDQGSFGLHRFSIRNTVINSTCSVPPTCNPSSLYRSADGSCNNLANTNWGQSNTGLQRILEPDYADGIFSPRAASDGGPLPSARRVSNIVTRNTNSPYTDITISLMSWGQFIDHDLSISPIFRLLNNKGIECCDENGHHLPKSIKHPQCMAIDIDANDPFYSRLGRLSCMNFVRSLPAPRPQCDLGYTEQLNALTHFLDASNIYGSDREQAAKLRQGRGGRLQESRPGSLPIDNTDADECFAKELGAQCYRAGDGRVNENLQLTLLHTLWLREHNRIATELLRLSRAKGKRLNDETLYQRTRRIIIAEWQHIIYHEWLPIVIGNKFMDVYGLKTKGSGFSDEYRPGVNPSINNEFSTAAFRFGHTLVEGTVHMFRNSNSRTGAVRLQDVLNNPSLMNSPIVVDGVARGLHLQPAQRFDTNVVDDIRNHLFQPPAGNHGMDLIALNIQRGREHGIPSYNRMRVKCGLSKLNSFNDLIRSGEIPEHIVRRFQSVYRSVDDIDLFIGGISERPVPGALLGHTFLCIVGDQFARLKKGDRFFYDLTGQPHSFTPVQLFEIRKATWARILCDNMPNVDKMQPLAFYVPNYYNKLTSCDSYSIPRVSLAAFA